MVTFFEISAESSWQEESSILFLTPGGCVFSFIDCPVPGGRMTFILGVEMISDNVVSVRGGRRDALFKKPEPLLHML